MKKYLRHRLANNLLISMLLLGNCSCLTYAEAKSSDYLTDQKKLLTTKQVQALDANASKTLPECGFVYRKVTVGKVTEDDIFQCIHKAETTWFGTTGYKSLGLTYQQIEYFHGHEADQELNRFHMLDDYLGNRLVPYILALPNVDQVKLLREIIHFHSDNLGFIKALMDQGISVKAVTLTRTGRGGNSAALCATFMLILNKNLAFYKNKKTLYESIPYVEQGYDPSYRWKDLLHITDPNYTICPEVIKRLAGISPTLLNKSNAEGETPLHQILISSANEPERLPLSLIKVLTTPININKKSSYGDTPLHTFIKVGKTTIHHSDKQVVQWLIE